MALFTPNQRSGEAACPLDAHEMLDLLPGLVAYFDHDLRYRYANATYADWRGLPPAALIGRHCRDVVGEDNFPLIERNLRKALAGEIVSSEYEVFSGCHARQVQGSYRPHRGPDGAVRGVVALVTDISTRDDLQQRIIDSEITLDQFFESAPIGLAIVGTGGEILRANPAFATMLGRPRDPLTRLSFQDVTHPDDLDADLDLLAQTLDGRRDGYRLDKRYLRPDGGIVQTSLTVTVARDPEGRVKRLLAQVEDVTRQRAAEQRIRRGVARLELAMHAIRGGFWHLDVGAGTFETSRELTRFVTGRNGDPLDLNAYNARIHAEDRLGAEFSELIQGQADQSSAEYRLATARGVRWMRCDCRLVRDSQGRPEQVVGVVLDITEERERQQRSQEEAERDALTGLLNRRGLERRLRQLGKDAACGILAIDLDRFKRVNDAHGHAAGDLVLADVARRLESGVRSDDLVIRLGGDEFLVAMPGVTVERLAAIAQQLVGSLGQPHVFHGTELLVGGSVGVAWSSALPEDVADLIARADAALYAAKRAGRGRWELAD